MGAALGAAQLPRVAIVDGGLLGAQGGMGQVMSPMLEALEQAAGSRCVILTEDGRRFSSVHDARPVTSLASRARRRLVRDTQERTSLPLLRWLTGTYDIYYHVGLGLRPRVPFERLILSVHDIIGLRWPDEPAYPSWAGDVIHRAARITTVSEFSKRELCQQFRLPDDRVTVLYNGCDHRRFHPQPSADDARIHDIVGNGPYILCAGGQTRRKNVVSLLRAFARFQEAADARYRLVITGVNPRSDVGAGYRAASHDAGIGETVILTGYLHDDTIPSLYRGATAVAVPSLYEGFGLPVVEAMACGTPTLVSDASSLPEVAGDAALSVDARSTEALAAGLERITGDEPLRAALRRKGLARASTFTWQRCAEETVAVFREVAARADKAGTERSRARRSA